MTCTTQYYPHSFRPPPPSRVCCAGCAPYYRKILVIVPGVAIGVAAIALVFLSLLIYYRNKELQKLCVSGECALHGIESERVSEVSLLLPLNLSFLPRLLFSFLKSILRTHTH